MVSRHVSVLQADPVLGFWLQGPVSSSQQTESSSQAFSVVVLKVFSHWSVFKGRFEGRKGLTTYGRASFI